RLWKYFADPLGIELMNRSFKMLLLNWWNYKTPNIIAKFITRILPLIVINRRFENALEDNLPNM
ncbi:hypothetical protein H5410_034260, partial [Solanum commersonii]